MRRALTLPGSAIRVGGDGTFVWVVGDGVASRRPVTLGLDDGIAVEVVEGLRPDDVVVDGRVPGLREGQAVDVHGEVP